MPGLISNYLGLIMVGAGLLLLIIFGMAARHGFRPALRPLGGYRRLPDQIGQAVESGGRLHISLGPTGITNEDTGVALAGLALLDAAAEASTFSDQGPIATTSDVTLLPVMSDVLRRTYRDQQRFDTLSARLVALDAVSLAGGATGMIADDEIQANLLVGSFGPEVALMAEAGSRRQISQTIGSDRLEGQAVAYVMADHALIGEEIFLARAYLTEQPSATAGLAAQDVLRWLVIGLIVFGAALQTLGLLR